MTLLSFQFNVILRIEYYMNFINFPFLQRSLFRRAQSTPTSVAVSTSKPPESSPVSPSASPCRPDSRPSTRWCPSVVDSVSWSSETGRPERPPSPSTPSSTRGGSTRRPRRGRSCTASTLPSARSSPPSLSSSTGSRALVRIH